MTADTTLAPASPLEPTRADVERADYPPPLLRPDSGGMAERFASRVGATNPVRVFLTAVLGGYLILAGLTIAVGLLFVEVVLSSFNRLDAWDQGIAEDLANGRTPATEDASWIGSTLSGGHVIPFVIGALLIVFAVQRKWLLAVYPLFLILVESGTYRATTFVVERQRPEVERLEQLPVDASFPSGHTAASLALYGGLLLLLASWVERTWFTVVASFVTIAVVVFVGWSRMFRGMHHLTDSIAALGVGLGAIVVVVFAARAATAATRNRRDQEERA